MFRDLGFCRFSSFSRDAHEVSDFPRWRGPPVPQMLKHFTVSVVVKLVCFYKSNTLAIFCIYDKSFIAFAHLVREFSFRGHWLGIFKFQNHPQDFFVRVISSTMRGHGFLGDVIDRHQFWFLKVLINICYILFRRRGLVLTFFQVPINRKGKVFFESCYI